MRKNVLEIGRAIVINDLQENDTGVYICEGRHPVGKAPFRVSAEVFVGCKYILFMKINNFDVVEWLVEL